MNNNKLLEENTLNNNIATEYINILKTLKIPWHVISCRLLHLSLIIYIFCFIVSFIFAVSDLFFLEIDKNFQNIKIANKQISDITDNDIKDSTMNNLDKIKNIYYLTIYTYEKRKEMIKYQFIYICICILLSIILNKFIKNNNFTFIEKNIHNIDIKICENYLEHFFSKLLYFSIPFMILILFFLHISGKYFSMLFISCSREEYYNLNQSTNSNFKYDEKNIKIFIFGIVENNFFKFIITSFKKAFFHFNHALVYLFILLCFIFLTFYIQLPLMIIICITYFFFLQQLLDFNYQSLSLDESVVKINKVMGRKYNIFYLLPLINNDNQNLFDVNFNAFFNFNTEFKQQNNLENKKQEKESTIMLTEKQSKFETINNSIRIFSDFILSIQHNTFNHSLKEANDKNIYTFNQIRAMFLLKFFYKDLNYANYILNKCFLNDKNIFSDSPEYLSLDYNMKTMQNVINTYKNKPHDKVFDIILNNIEDICDKKNNNVSISNILKYNFNYEGMILPCIHLSDFSLFLFIIKLIPFYFYLTFFCPYVFFVRFHKEKLNILYYYQQYFTKIYYININFKNGQYIPLYHENGEIIGGCDIIKNSFNITLVIDSTLVENNESVKIKNFLILYGSNSDAIINTFLTHENVNFMTDYGSFIAPNVKYTLNKMMHIVNYDLGIENLSKIFSEYNDAIFKDILNEILISIYPLLLERMHLQFNLLSGGQKIICAITKALLHMIKKLIESKNTNSDSQLSLFIIPYINGLDPNSRERLYIFLTKKLSIICDKHDIPVPFIIMTTNKLDDHLINHNNPLKNNVYIADGNFLPAVNVNN